MTRRAPSIAESFESAASAIDRVVVLLRAGLDIGQAVTHVEGSSHDDHLFGREHPSDPVTAVVSALLETCRLAGAPVAPALERESAVLTELAAAARDVEVAAAGPRATARIVAALPLAGLLLSFFLGFDVVGAVTGSILGAMCAAGGLGLSIAGGAWSRRIVRAATPVFAEPGLLYELVGVGLCGGLGAEAALELALRIASRATDEPGDLAEAGSDVERLVAVGRNSGASLLPLLHAQASLRRRRRATESRLAAERLASSLLVPLGLCALPAFVLLGVVPALLAVVSSTVI